MSRSLDNLSSERSDLLVQSLQQFGRVQFRALGASMWPVIRPRDILAFERIEPVQAELGDILLIRRAGQLYAHRYIRGSGPIIVLKGDAFPAPDVEIGRDEILARLVAVHRHGCEIRFHTRFRRLLGRQIARVTMHRIWNRSIALLRFVCARSQTAEDN